MVAIGTRCWLVTRAAEPVRHVSVKLNDFAGAENPVLVAEDKTHVAGEDVDPFVAVVCPWLGGDLAGRDDDLPGLHGVELAGERYHRSALDLAGLDPDAWVAHLGCAHKIVQWHPVGA